jgi:hypothetical protein
MKTLDELRSIIEVLAERIHAPKDSLPTYVHPREGAYPCIEIIDQGYHYFAMERGQLMIDRFTEDEDELLYWVFRSITFEIALDYEHKHRRPFVDFRRLMFAKNIELFGVLSKDWENRYRAEIVEILRKNPYEDKF